MVENKIFSKNNVDNKTLFYLESFGFCMARENKEGILVLYNKDCYNKYCFNNNTYISSIKDYNDDWTQNFSNLYDIKWIKECASEVELMYCITNETYFPPVDWQNPYCNTEKEKYCIQSNNILGKRENALLLSESRYE